MISASGAFQPRLEILPAAQLCLWDELASVPSHFTLYGGTAIALHLGHPESVDFDFFSRLAFDPDRLLSGLSFLAGCDVIQRQPGALTARVDRNGPVQVSFFATPHLGFIEPPVLAPDNGLRIARLTDLAGMKADVVQKRAEAKDYIDIDALMSAGITLPQALAAAKALQGPSFNPAITLKALAFFGDGNLAGLPAALKRRLQDAIRTVDLNRLPQMTVLRLPGEEH